MIISHVRNNFVLLFTLEIDVLWFSRDGLGKMWIMFHDEFIGKCFDVIDPGPILYLLLLNNMVNDLGDLEPELAGARFSSFQKCCAVPAESISCTLLGPFLICCKNKL